jgi:RND family efflux transporter MFP subunit
MVGWVCVCTILLTVLLPIDSAAFSFPPTQPSRPLKPHDLDGGEEPQPLFPWQRSLPFPLLLSDSQTGAESNHISGEGSELGPIKPLSAHDQKIEAAIVSPFQSASVPTEVGGIIEEFKFELGDLIAEGNTIAEISKKRYALAASKAEERLRALKLALKRAEQDRDIKSTLVSMDATSVQELLRAETEVEITQHKILETEIDLEQARLDLKACEVRAPFTGHLAMRYKEPHEALAPLERVCLLVDASKVYAIANVPENLVGHFKKGAKAKFKHSSGKQFFGKVEKVEPLMDPKTDTKRVHVLIDNSEGQLEPGMTGSVEPGQ